jgi:DNA topoisomerase-3
LLKSAELTGEWEQKLRKIEKGEYEAQNFKDELIEMVSQLTKKVIDSRKSDFLERRNL